MVTQFRINYMSILRLMCERGFKSQSCNKDRHYSLSSTDKEALDIEEYLRVYGWTLMHNQSLMKLQVVSY